jgi:hypothetical protein
MKETKEAISILIRPKTLEKLREYHYKTQKPFSHIIEDALLIFFESVLIEDGEDP